MYQNLLKKFKDSFYHSLSNESFKSMLYIRLIQGQQLVISLTSRREAEQYCYKMSHNLLILAVLTFYLIMKFSRLNYSWTKGKLWVLSESQVWIQYLSHWRLYCKKFQVNLPTCTQMLMVTKIPALILCVPIFVKSMIILLLWKMMLLVLQLSVICNFFQILLKVWKRF